MPRCLLLLLVTFFLVISTVVAASVPSIRQKRSQKQLTLNGDDIMALERILTDVDRVLGSVQVKMCGNVNSEECKAAALASRADYTPESIARELNTEGQRKRWAPSCSVGGGMPGYDCRMDQIIENDEMDSYVNGGISPGKRNTARNRKSWDPSCNFGIGISPFACRMKQITDNEEMNEYVNGDVSPGKRQTANHSLVEDLARKRLGLKLLQRYLADKQRELETTRKRNCRINLGGHCATETVADMVDLYHFLSSADSPGKRRKRRQAAKPKINPATAQ